jgi:hypothetical protein
MRREAGAFTNDHPTFQVVVQAVVKAHLAGLVDAPCEHLHRDLCVDCMRQVLGVPFMLANTLIAAGCEPPV